MRACPTNPTSHKNDQPREVCKNHANVQLVKRIPLLHCNQRNPPKVMSQVNKILTHGRRDEIANIGYAHDRTKLFNSGSYFHTVKLENMSSRN